MKRLLILILTFHFTNVFSQTGWFEQETGADVTLRSIQMIDENTGYCVGGDILFDAIDIGIIIKTTNGGSNWITQSPPGFNKILYSVNFTNSMTGYACGKDKENYTIFKTTNGGEEWLQQTLPNITNTPPLHSIYFVNDNTGYSAGLGSAVFKTTNGGIDWTDISFPFLSNFYSITFTDDNTGFLGSDGVIYKTTDGGNDWDTIFTSGSGGTAIRSLYFTDNNTGYASGTGIILKTTDSGNNWSTTAFPGLELFSIYFPSQQTGYCSGDITSIYKTTDSGESWFQQFQGGSGALNSIYFADDTTGFTVGNSGYMLRTISGGSVDINIISSEIPSEFKLKQNYPNPFNPITTIEFDIPKSSLIRLTIFDYTGKSVNEINRRVTAGTYKYNFDGSNLPSGAYFYRLSTDNFTEVRKMVLIK